MSHPKPEQKQKKKKTVARLFAAGEHKCGTNLTETEHWSDLFPLISNEKSIKKGLYLVSGFINKRLVLVSVKELMKRSHKAI